MSTPSTVKTTNEKVVQFRRTYEAYASAPRNAGRMSKFLYSLQKMYTKLKAFEDEINYKNQEINIKYATKDRDGFILTEKVEVTAKGQKTSEGRFKYLPKDQLEMIKAKRDMLSEVVETPCHLFEDFDDLPTDIDFVLWDGFQPFVVPEEPTPDLLQKLIERSQGKPIKQQE